MTSKGMQNTSEKKNYKIRDLLNSLKSKQPQCCLYSGTVEFSLGACTHLWGFLWQGLFPSFGRGLCLRFKSAAALMNGSDGSDSSEKRGLSKKQ